MAHYLCAGSTVCAHRCSARQRQAAVMALFLTGMINDGAHTANGPGETRLYQTAKKGAEGGSRQRCVGANRVQAPPPPPPFPCFAMDRTAQVSLSKASSSLSATVREEEGGQPYLVFTREDLWESQRGEWEDLLEDGGLKLSELGSWSPSVALGSDVAISPLVLEL